MRYGLSDGDLAELDSMPVSTSGNSYAEFMHAKAFLQAGMEPGPAPKVAQSSVSGFSAPEYPQSNPQPSWLQEEW